MVLKTKPVLVLPTILPEDLLREAVLPCLPCSTLPSLCQGFSKSDEALDGPLSLSEDSRSGSSLSNWSLFDDDTSSDDIMSEGSAIDNDEGKVIFSTSEHDCILFNTELQNMAKDKSLPGQEPLCIIKEIPAKGLAMVALQKLYPGDIIMAELPLFVMPLAVFDGDESEDWLDQATNKLSCQKRELLHSLTDCRNPRGDPTTLGRFYTNCMFWGDDITVCPVMARANHSCRPNAEFLPRVDLGRNELRATYVIEAGDEVTINYMAMAEEGSDVREVRQEYLRRLYGFQCTCKACTLQDLELEADDEVREELKELQARGSHNWTQPEVLGFLAGASKIQGKLSFIMDTMEECWAVASDQTLKLDYCLKGLSLALTVYGQGSPKATEWKERMVELQLWADCYLPQHG